MSRLWRMHPAIFFVAVATGGCAGQSLEGRWQGPFPLEDAKACELRMNSNRTFSLSCRQDSWIGAGRYRADGNRLVLQFTILHRYHVPVRRLPTVETKLEGHGNTIDLTNGAGQSYRFVRAL